jgi:hypothetical protein
MQEIEEISGPGPRLTVNGPQPARSSIVMAVVQQERTSRIYYLGNSIDPSNASDVMFLGFGLLLFPVMGPAYGLGKLACWVSQKWRKP